MARRESPLRVAVRAGEPAISRRTFLGLGLGACALVGLPVLVGCSNPVRSFSVNYNFLCSGTEVEVVWDSSRALYVQVQVDGEERRSGEPEMTGEWAIALEPGTYEFQAVVDGEVRRRESVRVLDRRAPPFFVNVTMTSDCAVPGGRGPLRSPTERLEAWGTFAPDVVVMATSLASPIHNRSGVVEVTHDGRRFEFTSQGQNTTYFDGTPFLPPPWTGRYVGGALVGQYCVAPDPTRGDDRNPPPPITVTVGVGCE